MSIEKRLLLYLPYLIIGLYASKFPQAWRLSAGGDMATKLLAFSEGLSLAFATPLPSLHMGDLLFGLCMGGLLRLAVYLKAKNAKKYRHGVEYGSARWGNAGDIQPYKNPIFRENVILTQTEHLTMNNRPKDPKTARNKNVLIVGGSGSGKTRFWLKPNLMQCHSSYCITDPKGDIVCQTGKLLQREGYSIKILNTINFAKSMHYNPFAYIKSEKDILKLVNTLIQNTKGDGKSGDDFWVKAETLLYTALIGYLNYEAPEEEQNFNSLIEFINEFAVRDTSRKIRHVFRAKALEGKHISSSTPYGYLRDPQDKGRWIVDVQAAEVVKRIFNMVIDGHGVYQIAKILSNDKVLIPSAHWESIGADNRRNSYSDKYRWGGSVVAKILTREEYMGHTVSFKTHTVSYKIKKSVPTPMEERVIFENTHEAIIDPETWHNAQRLRRTVRRPTKGGQINRLTGLLYCADCGAKLTHNRGAYPSGRQKQRDNYCCSNYRGCISNCTQHYIRTCVVEELILQSIRDVSEYVKNSREDFLKLILGNFATSQESIVMAQKKKLTAHRKRYNELDRIIRQIYEDNVAGKLSDKRFEKLSGDYEEEQSGVEHSMALIEAEILAYETHTINTDKFLDIVERYTSFTEITTPMLNEFIEKIVVHERVKGPRYTKSQDVDIYFNFVGKIDLPQSREEPPKPPKPKPPQKRFRPFEDYMNSQTQKTLQLNISDIEEILGVKLSQSYYNHRSLWYPGKHRPLGKIIYNAGYDVQKLNLESRNITLLKATNM